MGSLRFPSGEHACAGARSSRGTTLRRSGERGPARRQRGRRGERTVRRAYAIDEQGVAVRHGDQRVGSGWKHAKAKRAKVTVSRRSKLT